MMELLAIAVATATAFFASPLPQPSIRAHATLPVLLASASAPPIIRAQGPGFVELEVALTGDLSLIIREADVDAQDTLVDRAVMTEPGAP